MFNYQPPKSQVWGHRLGRLTSAQIWERAIQFLQEQTVIEAPLQADFSVVWVPGRCQSLASDMDRFHCSLGPPAAENSLASRVDEPAQCVRWNLPIHQMGPIAAWLDKVHESASERITARAGGNLMFKWSRSHGEGSTDRGGMFGVHLGTVRAITTMFSFASREHYHAIKQYLADIGLVELSDKHLKPARQPRKARVKDGT
jgi:hypothetical protein